MVYQISSSYVACFKSWRHWSFMRIQCKVLKGQPPKQPDVCTCKHETRCITLLEHPRNCCREIPDICQKPQSLSGPRLIPSPSPYARQKAACIKERSPYQQAQSCAPNCFLQNSATENL
eukprot:1045336-Pelagomonas_calceolata.AAC.1